MKKIPDSSNHLPPKTGGEGGGRKEGEEGEEEKGEEEGARKQTQTSPCSGQSLRGSWVSSEHRKGRVVSSESGQPTSLLFVYRGRPVHGSGQNKAVLWSSYQAEG